MKSKRKKPVDVKNPQAFLLFLIGKMMYLNQAYTGSIEVHKWSK